MYNNVPRERRGEGVTIGGGREGTAIGRVRGREGTDNQMMRRQSNEEEAGQHDNQMARQSNDEEAISHLVNSPAATRQSNHDNQMTRRMARI